MVIVRSRSSNPLYNIPRDLPAATIIGKTTLLTLLFPQFLAELPFEYSMQPRMHSIATLTGVSIRRECYSLDEEMPLHHTTERHYSPSEKSELRLNDAQRVLLQGCAVEPIIAQVIRESWCRETAYDAESWSRMNPASGQCAVTALILQDFLGGNLLCGQIDGEEHYWNLLPERGEIDLTREQFKTAALTAAPSCVSRDYVLSFPDTQRRYKRLLKSVRGRLRRVSIRPVHFT